MRPIRWKPHPGGTNLTAGELAHVVAERVRLHGRPYVFFTHPTPPLVPRPWTLPWWYSGGHYGRGPAAGQTGDVAALPGRVLGRPCVRDDHRRRRALVLLGWVPDAPA